MGVGYYIFIVGICLFGLISIVVKITSGSKLSLLDEMFENNDISSDIYKKYKKNI